MQRHSRSRPPETVCLAAILKDEKSFVEEWVAHHRLLGVDHFFLYDNDPLQPLQDILRLHRDYVTILPWLVEHDDPNYPGHTKQLKAYRHCLDNGAANYDWVTFLDGDEFIILNEHEHLQAFLADFQDCDLVALNWHVFGHDGHFDDPPGLVLEFADAADERAQGHEQDAMPARCHRQAWRTPEPGQEGPKARRRKQDLISGRSLSRQDAACAHQPLSMPVVYAVDEKSA